MSTVDKITFQQTFPTGNYANMKLGIEMSLVPGVDDVQEAFEQAKKIVNDAFILLNPQITWNDQPTSTTSIPDVKIEKTLGITIEDINSCADKIVLESYRLLIKGKPELEKAYLSKLKEFICQ